MPWTGTQFASRHNKKLHGAKADHAARIANAVLRSGVPEGESIAIASKWAKHHAAGGDVEPLDALVARLSPKIPRRASGGFLHGSDPGRADTITTSAPGGSYVVPADVVAGIGQGNSLAGAKVIQEMLERGPYGIPMPRGRAGNNIPSPPHPRAEYQAGGSIPIFAKGGGNRQESPVKLSDGEFVIPPAHVVNWGGGNLKRGHRVFDAWVLKKRKEHIAKLKKLPGPVRT